MNVKIATPARSLGTVLPINAIGRDEMNLAEFPITLLTDRAPAGQLTLRYEGQHGTLTVAGTEAYGLPTAADADVIVALIQLTRHRNNFADSVVNFTRYELLKLLNWPDVGKSYRRLSESLNRWASVTLRYQGSWWNNRTKQNGSVTMHILESVTLYERAEGTTQALLPLSSFTWNRAFLESCQADNLKRLDLAVYFSLKHPSSKRLFRFLDKRFYGKADQSFRLDEIAFERVGLSRNYAGNAGKIKEKLQPAIEELEAVGFLESLSRADRYRKEEGDWLVRFVRKPERSGLPATFEEIPANDPPTPDLVAELVKRGVTKATAAELVRDFGEDSVRLRVEYFDWRMATADKPKKPVGYLVKSIKLKYDAPDGFISKAEQQRRKEKQEEKDRQADADTRRKEEQAARKRVETEAIAAYWQSLSSEQQKELQTIVDAEVEADPELQAITVGSLRDSLGRMAKELGKGSHIKRLLQANGTLPSDEA